MKLFDTHAHLTDERFDGDRDALIASFDGDGVKYVLTCGTDLADSEASLLLCERHDCILLAAGIHPHEAAGAPDDYLKRLEQLLTHEKAVALGEIGLDYHYDFSPRDVQKRVFEEQLEVARSLNVPVVLHDREAHADMLEVLRRFKGIRGVMHCYSASAEMVPSYVELGLHFGVGGSMTFKNAQKTKAAVRAMPTELILLETDCPYLAPVPHRGERNEPKYTAQICAAIADERNQSTQSIAKATYQNAIALFFATV